MEDAWKQYVNISLSRKQLGLDEVFRELQLDIKNVNTLLCFKPPTCSCYFSVTVNP
jgi:hypothetical protein